MVYQRVHKSSSLQPPSRAKSAQPVPRPVASPAQRDLPRLAAPEGSENEAMDEVWAQRSEKTAQPGHSFADILVRSTAQQTAAQAQPANAPDENRTGMPVPLKAGLEQLAGLDLSAVRVHYNSDKPAQLNALAYTQGHEIEVGPGQERHLPHEAWHVVQQLQGRVRPTMQAQGVPINDDSELEGEADRMGKLAVAQRLPVRFPALQAKSITNDGGFSSESADRATHHPSQPTESDRPVQRIVSVAAFQAATPKTLGHRRGPNIQAVDTDLGTYTGARTHANAAALYIRCVTYLGANHQPARIAAVTNLRNEAQRERDLLAQIGDANAHLIDALITQVGGAPGVPDLLNLAGQVGPANANVLPALIATVTPANVGALVASAIIPAMGGAEAYLLNQLIPLAGGMGGVAALTALIVAAALHNLDLLPSMVRNSGGAAQMGNLRNLISRAGKTTADVFDLAREAGTDAARFQRFHDDVALFTSAAAPAVVPVAITAARNAYNTAKNNHADLAYNAAIAAILPHVTAMQAAATQMQGAANNMGAPPGLRNNLAPCIININTHQAGLAAGLPLAFTFQDVRDNITTLDNILNGLRNWANNQAVGADRTTVLNERITFTNAKGPFDGVVFPAAARPRDVGQIDFAHFFERHTRTHFDFTDIKPQNTMWPFAWDPPPGPGANVSAALGHGFNALAAANRWFQGGVAENGVVTGFAPTMRMVAYNMPDGTLRLGMVFPEANLAAGVIDYTDSQLRAIHKVI